MKFDLGRCQSVNPESYRLGDFECNLTLNIFTNFKKICFFESEILSALSGGIFENFNITLIVSENDKNVQTLMENDQSIDLALTAWAINGNFLKFANAHWYIDEYNMAILSASYTLPPNLVSILNSYTLNVWIFILMSVLLVTFSNQVLNNRLSIIEELILTMRPLLHQCYLTDKINQLLMIWTFMALILSTCFCSTILSSYIKQEIKTIDNLDQLLESDLKVIVANQSSIWWEFKNHFVNNTILNENLEQLYNFNRIEFMFEEDVDKDIMRKIANRKMAYIKDAQSLVERKLMDLDLNLEIGSKKYFPALLGHPINKRLTEARNQTYNIIRILVESGINQFTETRRELFFKLSGYQLLERYLNNHNHAMINNILDAQEHKVLELKTLVNLFLSLITSYSLICIAYICEALYHWSKMTFLISLIHYLDIFHEN